jgi:hypothetical protein
VEPAKNFGQIVWIAQSEAIIGRYVDGRYWPLADMSWCTANVRFRGVKRTFG